MLCEGGAFLPEDNTISYAPTQICLKEEALLITLFLTPP